jgi:hypothetical protein
MGPATAQKHTYKTVSISALTAHWMVVFYANRTASAQNVTTKKATFLYKTHAGSVIFITLGVQNVFKCLHVYNATYHSILPLNQLRQANANAWTLITLIQLLINVFIVSLR